MSLFSKIQKTIPESITTDNSRHFPEYGTFTRFRYESEVQKRQTSSLPSVIKNLDCYIGSKLVLQLCRCHSDNKHTSLKLYKTKINENFIENSNGDIEGTIKGKELNLGFLGLKRVLENKEQKNGIDKEEESNNCRIKMTVLEYNHSEISKVYRNKCANFTNEIEIDSVTFPLNAQIDDKSIIIVFSKNVAYYHSELVLFDGNECINSKSETKTYIGIKITYQLADFKNGIPGSLQLQCPTFRKAITINNMDVINTIYSNPRNEEMRIDFEDLVRTPEQISIIQSKTSRMTNDDNPISPMQKVMEKRKCSEFMGRVNFLDENEYLPIKRAKHGGINNNKRNKIKRNDREWSPDLSLPCEYNVYEFVSKEYPEFQSVADDVLSSAK